MTTHADALRQVPLFAGMTDRALTAVAELVSEVTYDDGASLAREGDPGDRFLLIVGGDVDVTRGGNPLRRLGVGDGPGPRRRRPLGRCGRSRSGARTSRRSSSAIPRSASA
jgi:hypothetical protein